MNQKSCKKCGSISLYTKPKGNQTGLYCNNCGAWIKWLSKDEIREFEHERLKTSETSRYGEWIPCSERLPESEEPEILCLVTCQDFNVSECKWENARLGIMSYLTKHRIWNTKALASVLAWMPLPEPFKLMER